ncbi:related to monooxygenase [Cephalotrichum gorgonifer]|uniref:Related to monooxygenase n=1 Tax=Cephalotrichum gorgonifer TaxID=2041049 RepID=A0AAE8T053_9PEZI|nr:related to monooxygenase [Cephalotrichum gorgonifer]
MATLADIPTIVDTPGGIHPFVAQAPNPILPPGPVKLSDASSPPPTTTRLGNIRSVAVIGAGISGVATAAHLLLAGLDVTVFERSGNIGGVWVFDARTPLTPPFPHVAPPAADSQYVSTPDGLTAEQASVYHASPGPAYEGLTNNIGTAVMRSTLLDWPEGTGKVITADQVKDYIQELAQKYGVVDRVRLWTRVEGISKPPGEAQWTVRTRKFIRDGEDAFHLESQTSSFDAVVVASGHYDVPRVPDIPGLSEWKERYPGRVAHSKAYRSPEAFRDSTVLIIGAGVSSYDIANQIHEVGGKSYQVSRDPTRVNTARQEGLAESCERVPAVTKLVLDPASNPDEQTLLEDTAPIPGKVVLEDGRELIGIHHVVVATGYITTYPFLGDLENPTVAAEAADDKVVITSDGYTMHNLHKDLFYIPDPTLAFVGVLYNTSTFSLFDFQARVLARIFKGEATLPSRDEMHRLHRARKAKHKPGEKFHSLSLQDVAYAEEILESVNRDLEKAGLPTMTAFDEKWHAGFADLKAFVASVRPDLDLDGERADGG